MKYEPFDIEKVPAGEIADVIAAIMDHLKVRLARSEYDPTCQCHFYRVEPHP